MRAILTITAFIWLLAGQGCGAPDPVLQGVPEAEGTSKLPPPILEAIEARSDQQPGVEKIVSRPYVKPPGVFVDIRHLGGRAYATVQSELMDQLGDIEDRQDLGTRYGEELVFAHGSVRVIRDIIYWVQVSLPDPVTRSEALELTGFPPYVDNWLITHREFRLGHSWDFRRIIMRRAPGYEDRVMDVQAWKERPERVGR